MIRGLAVCIHDADFDVALVVVMTALLAWRFVPSLRAWVDRPYADERSVEAFSEFRRNLGDSGPGWHR